MNQDEAQSLLAQAQVYQQQMQEVITKKETLKMQLMEVENALKEISGGKEHTVYKVSGPIIIKKPAAEIIKELSEKKETAALHIKTLESGEARIKKQIEALREKLTGISSSQ